MFQTTQRARGRTKDIRMLCITKAIPFSTLTDNDFFLSVIKGTKGSLNYTADFDFLPSPAQQRLYNELNNIINQNSINEDNNDEDNDQLYNRLQVL